MCIYTIKGSESICFKARNFNLINKKVYKTYEFALKLCKNELLGPEGSPVPADDVLRDVGDSVTYGKANSQSGSEMNDRSHKFHYSLREA
jgi:hypothetical protein